MTAPNQDTPDDPEYHTLGPGARVDSRYATVTIEDERIIVYDIAAEDAWIQTDTAVPRSDAA